MENAETLLNSLRELTAELESHDTDITTTEIQGLSERIIKLVDEFPPCDNISKNSRAYILYCKGKALTAINNFDKNTESALSRSVKLDPTNAKTWLCLGELYYANRDYAQSKQCFQSCLEYLGETPEILRKLSMVSRFLGEAEERAQNVVESVKLAKRAVELNMNDGQSWYVLGNAYLTNFFTNATNNEEMRKALSAYAQAERRLPRPSPDLHFNRATILKFMEKYFEAINEFYRANELDPELHADQNVQEIINRLHDIISRINTKCGLKRKILSNLINSIPVNLNSNPFASQYQIVPSPLLNIGNNKGKLLACKLIHTITTDPSETPAIFLIVDSSCEFLALSIYNTNSSVHNHLKFNAGIFIRDPVLVLNQFEFSGKTYSYKGVRVSDPETLMVDNKVIRESFAQSVIVNEPR